MFGERIAELRNKRGLSQYALAEKLGFSRGKLANYEQGTRQPDYETLKKIANFFDVTTDYLLGVTDNPNSDISIAYDGGPQYEDEDEREFIEQQLEQYRKMKKRMQERLEQDKKD